jgi:hypothetical protein
MGEAALSYWQDEHTNATAVADDEKVPSDYVVLMDGETDDDWKYGSD